MPEWLIPNLKEGGLIAVIAILLLVVWGIWKLFQAAENERKSAQQDLMDMQRKSLEAGHAMARAIDNNSRVIEQVLRK